MAVDVGMHRADQADFINDLREMRQKFRNLHSASTALLKLPWSAEKFLGGALHKAVGDFPRIIFATAPTQFGLGVEKVHMTRASVHEKRNHRSRAASLCRELGVQIEHTECE